MTAIMKVVGHTSTWVALAVLCVGANAGTPRSSVRAVATDDNTLGISSGSLRGISSGSLRGISSGSLRGISSGSLRGISSGSLRGISSGSLRGAVEASSSSTWAPPVAFGPIDAINNDLETLEVLGQTIAFPGVRDSELSPGMLVLVFGQVLGEGFAAGTAILASTEMYVPGATSIFVSGYPSSIDTASGTIHIGTLVVDYTALLSTGDLAFGSDLVTFTGIQPVPQATFVATTAPNSSSLSDIGVQNARGISTGSRR